MRRDRVGALILLTLMLAAPAYSQRSAGGSPLKNFTAMSFPKSSVEVGAKWLSTGPNGAGADPANLVTVDGLSETQLSKSLKQGLSLSFASFFGLSESSKRDLKVNYGKLSSVRVASLFDIKDLSSGQAVFYEAVKAQDVSFTTDSATAAQIEAQAKIKGLEPTISNVALSGGGEATSTVKVGGKELFIAFRVVRLGVARTKTYRVALQNDASGYTRVRAYDISITDPNGCVSSPVPNPVTLSVTNMSVPGPRGFSTTSYTFIPGSGPIMFALPTQEFENKIITSNIRVAYNPARKKDDVGNCLTSFSPKINFIDLNESVFGIANVDKPGVY